MEIINGDYKFMVLPSLLIVVAIFIILHCILTFIICKSGNILPIEALRKNENSKNGEIKAPDTYRYDPNGNKIGIEKEGKNCTLQIACIMQYNKMMYEDAYIDIHNQDFIQESAWVNKIYINGDYQYIDNRYLMIEIVVRILVIIASIGWINSLRNIFLSCVKD